MGVVVCRLVCVVLFVQVRIHTIMMSSVVCRLAVVMMMMVVVVVVCGV